MSNDQDIHSEATRMSRRDLLRRAALGGLGVATATSLGSGMAVPTFADNITGGSIEEFLIRAYQTRAQVMSSGDSSLLRQLYDPANSSLLAFETARTHYFHRELPALWDASIVGFDSNLSLVSLDIAGSTAIARLYQGLGITWIAHPQPPHILPPEVVQRRQNEPERFQPTPTGPKGEIRSTLGTRHELHLIQGSSGWRIAHDAYDESSFGARSPDLTDTSWAAVGGPGPEAANSTLGPAPQVTPSNTCTVDWTAVMNYASQYCCYLCRNNGYCDYSQCGGDCTNFVSQCWNAGGMHWDSTWFCTNTGCGACGSGSWAASSAWDNVNAQHSWLLNSGRGNDVSSQTYLGFGDVINYDWTGDGIWDHAAIVTGFDANNNALVSAHTNDVCKQPWQLGSAARYRYTTVHNTYNC